MTPRAQGIVEQLAEWPVSNASAAWFGPALPSTEFYGDPTQVFRLASLTKPLFSMAVLVAVEEASLTLDDQCDVSQLLGEPEPVVVTVRQLLSHASGLAPARGGRHTASGRRRVYSNLGFDVVGSLLHQATGMTPAHYLHEAVCAPLQMTDTHLAGSPAHAGRSTVNDFVRLVAEFLAPTLVSPATSALVGNVQFSGLDGVVPGYGRHTPNPWGAGCEVRGEKAPHWTGMSQSPATYGHFGQAGTFFWIDPDRGAGCIAFTDTDFGPWAVDRWSHFNETVFSQATGRTCA